MGDHSVGRGEISAPQALATLLTEKRFPLLAFIERRMGPALRQKLEPDDIFQEVSAEAVRSWASVSPAEQDQFGWLCQVAERRIIDAHRRFFSAEKRNAAKEVSLHGGRSADDSQGGLINLLVATITTATQAVARNDREAKLYAALATLPEEQREALRMRYVEGRPSKEIAERLGKTDGSVRVMLTRALKTLQTRLEIDDTSFLH